MHGYPFHRRGGGRLIVHLSSGDGWRNWGTCDLFFNSLNHEDKIVAYPAVAVAPNGYRGGSDVDRAVLNRAASAHGALHDVLSLELLRKVAGERRHCQTYKRERSLYFLFGVGQILATKECASFHVQVVSVDCSSEYKIEVQRSWSILL